MPWLKVLGFSEANMPALFWLSESGPVPMTVRVNQYNPIAN
jgi:hypothetical protein